VFACGIEVVPIDVTEDMGVREGGGKFVMEGGGGVDVCWCNIPRSYLLFVITGTELRFGSPACHRTGFTIVVNFVVAGAVVDKSPLEDIVLAGVAETLGATDTTSCSCSFCRASMNPRAKLSWSSEPLFSSPVVLQPGAPPPGVIVGV